jgi:serralysin
VLNIHQFLAEESNLNQDINGDSITGISSTSEIGNITLFTTPSSYSLDTNPLDPLLLVPITYLGNQVSATNPGSGWTTIAAAADPNGGFDIYWKNTLTNTYAMWDLNSSGVFLSSSILNATQLLAQESSLAFDLNRDGSVGVLV